jgi:filamentous hemagglutinin family protein
MSPHKRKNSLPPECTAPKRGARPLSFPVATATAIAAVLALQRPALAGPTGGTVVQGSAGISQEGNTTNINQSSNKAIIDWQRFSIAPQETVNFNQPSSSAVTLNRVIGNEQSVISGALNANGQVFIVNSAGVLFSKGSQVNVGGIVASTLDISNTNFMAGNYVFSGSSTASVVNQGSIHAHDGGYVALLGKSVSNEGAISATLGTVAMASGLKTTLNFAGDSLIDVTIDEGVLNALVENKAAIKADGGRVILTARAADAVLSAQVNNSGVIQARTMAALTGGGAGAARAGSIKLLASGGTVHVAGKLDASAPKSGKGGKIETSGNRVTVAGDATITTKAASGENGTWLIDPTNFTISAGTGDQTSSGIGSTTLLNELANGNVVIVTSLSGGDAGDINVNAALDWSSTSATPSANSLTLAAANSINVNAPVTWSAGTLTLNAGANINVNNVMTASGTANFAANYGHVVDASGNSTAAVTGTGINADGHTPYGLYTLQGTSAAGTYAGKINFAGMGTVKLNGTQYTVIESAADLWGAANPVSTAVTTYKDGSTTTTTTVLTGLPATSSTTVTNSDGSKTVTTVSYQFNSTTPIASNGNYILGADISSPVTAVIPSLGYSVGVAPTAASAIGADATPFVGNFNGFGHTINVNVGAYPVKGVTGLFGTIGASGVVSNINLNAEVTSGASASASGAALGAIADVNRGTIVNTVATNFWRNYGQTELTNTVAVPSGLTVTDVGGFVGENYGLIVNSWTAGGVAGSTNIGGFVGANEQGGSIYTSFVRWGNSGVTPSAATVVYAGGFAGVNSGLISQSYARAGVTTATSTYDSNFNLVYTVSPNSIAAGFVGQNTSTGIIDQSYVNYGQLSGPEIVYGAYSAGFVGDNAGKIANSYTLAPDYTNFNEIAYTAGFAYANSGTISTSYAQLGSYNAKTYAFVDQNNGGTTTGDYYSYKGDPSAAQKPSDSSTAKFLTVAQSGVLSNFVGFDSAVWGTPNYTTPTSGYDTPILRQLPVLIGPTTSAPVYGSTASQIVASSSSGGVYLNAIGLQGVDGTNYGIAVPLSQFALVTPASGLIDAGSYSAGSTVTSNLYSNIGGAFTIAPAQLTLASGVVADKTYDGTTAGTVNNGLANGGLVGLVGAQTLNIDYLSAVFSDKNAAQSKKATVAFTVADGANGGKASNYIVSDTATATINPKTISASFSAADKTYDGSATATATANPPSGVVAGDTVAVDYALALFADKNAGQNKAVTVSGLTLSGTDEGNYTLQTTSVQTTASILPRVLDLYGTEVAATTTSFAAGKLFAKNAVPGDVVGFTGTVTLAGTAAGVQPIASVSGASVNNANYTLAGATGSVLIGGASLALDKVVSGTVDIASSGATTTVTESTNSAIIDWLRFSIPGGYTVNFVQPGATSIVLNRVTGNEQSVIDGALNANGRVFIVNSNGILFSGSSQVNVGALVATTLNIDDSNFENGAYQFASVGGGGSVTALGSINVADGGFAALASAGGVTFSGVLTAPGGTAVLAAAKDMNLTLDSSSPALTKYALGSLSGAANVAGSLNVGAASGNGGLIETAGDTVVLGKTLAMDTGTNGTWSYSQNGDILIGAKGAFSGKTVSDNLAIRNFSLNSYKGAVTDTDPVNWSADERLTLTAATNININNAITATGDHAGLTLAYGGSAQTGVAAAGYDYFINNQTIGRDGSITVGPAAVTLTGANASLNIDGHAYTLIQSMSQLESLPVSYVLDQNGQKILDYNTYSYAKAITGYYALGRDLTATQTYSGPLIASFGGVFAGLGHKIGGLTIKDAAGNGGDGLIGAIGVSVLDGNYDNVVVAPGTVRDFGLSNINISGPGISSSGGLASSSSAGSTISNVYVTGSISTGTSQRDYAGSVGGLVGNNAGLITHSHVDIAIAAPGAVEEFGGLVGTNWRGGLIAYSSAKGSIYVPGFAFADGGWTSTRNIGGLVGWNLGAIDHSFADVDITANTATEVGGLVGLNYSTAIGSASITNSSAGGSITSTWYALMAIQVGNIGGVVGDNQGGALSNISSTTNITVTATKSDPNIGEANLSNVGGLVGNNEESSYTYIGGSITGGSYNGTITATGDIQALGGAVGTNSGGTISGVQAAGSIISSQATVSFGPGATVLVGPTDVGGLVGANSGGLSNSSSSMNVNGQYDVGGAVGTNTGTISNVSTSGAVTGIDFVGGVAGQNFNSITDSKASGDVNGRDNVGGLVGANAYYGMDKTAVAVLTGSASGNVNGRNNVGGAVGFNGGKFSGIAKGNVNGNKNVGGLVGENGGQLFQFGDKLNGTVGAGSAEYGDVTGNTNVGLLIGLNNDGSTVTNAFAFGEAFVGGKETNELTGLDNGTSTNNSYQDLRAQKAAAAKQAAQKAAAAAAAATVTATTDAAMTAGSPPKASQSTAGTQAVYSNAAPKFEDNADVNAPVPAPPAPTGSEPEHRTRRAAADTTSGGHRQSHGGGGGGGGGGFGASIRSIEINGQHFDLEQNKPKDGAAPGDAR